MARSARVEKALGVQHSALARWRAAALTEHDGNGSDDEAPHSWGRTTSEGWLEAIARNATILYLPVPQPIKTDSWPLGLEIGTGCKPEACHTEYLVEVPVA